jgi:hypothetical protein
VSYYAHATTHSKHKKAGADPGSIDCALQLVLITSLVERGHENLEGGRVVGGAHKGLSRFQLRRQLRDLRDVAGVHADGEAGGQRAVQLALYTRDDGSRIRARGGEAEPARVAGLDGLVGRRDRAARGVEHEHRRLRVQVAVRVVHVFESGTDVAESDGGGIGGIRDEENVGHCGVLSRRAGFSALNCFNYNILSGEISGIIVPDFRGRAGCARCAVVASGFSQAHTGIIAD